MSEVVLQKPEMLVLLWLIFILLALYVYAAFRRRRSLLRFIDAGLLNRSKVSVSPIRRNCRAALLLLAAGLITLALTRPGWNPRPKSVESRGRDVIFLLDVSRSMLAEDLAPNRLERAKLMIADCLPRVEGDRVALLAFAGKAAVKCPLTLDYGFFQTILRDVSTDSVRLGGTMLGEAVRKTVDVLFKEPTDYQTDIILITDGEDQGSFPVEAAHVAGERGVRILVIGLGDENGSRIPMPEKKRPPVMPQGGGGFLGYMPGKNFSKLAQFENEEGSYRTLNSTRGYLRYRGQEVRSKLDAETLRRMAKATPGGMYFNVGTGAIDLGAVYEEVVASAEKKDFDARTLMQYGEGFQFCLALAFAALCLESMISERRSVC